MGRKARRSRALLPSPLQTSALRDSWWTGSRGSLGTSLLPTLSSLTALFSLHFPAFGDGDLLLPNTKSPRRFAFLPLPSEICCCLTLLLGDTFSTPSQITLLNSNHSCSHTEALVPKGTDPAHTQQQPPLLLGVRQHPVHNPPLHIPRRGAGLTKRC